MSPEHLEKAQQYLGTLTSEPFQYYEDVVDRLVSLLNEQAGTDYPLMDEASKKHDNRTNNGSGVLWKLGKWMVMEYIYLLLQEKWSGQILEHRHWKINLDDILNSII